MTSLQDLLSPQSFGTALGYTFYFSYASIGITLLIFGVAAVRRKEIKPGLLAALFVDTMIWMISPLLMQLNVIIIVLFVSVVVFGIDIMLKHK